MAQRRATFLTYGNEERSNQIRTFIEEAGIILTVRDLKTAPMSFRELSKLVGYIPLTHFLNPGSPSFHEHGLDEKQLSREELLNLMVADQSLLRTPIVISARLMTVGYDKKKLSEMLQIGENVTQIVGEGYREAPRKNGQRASSGAGK